VKESPVFIKCYDLLRWLIPRTLDFPKRQRGVIARQVQQHAFSLYEALTDAAMDEGATLDHLRRADRHLMKLRKYVRLCRDWHLLSVRQYGYACGLMSEVGRLLGGWIRTVEGAVSAT
jgi:hypothetical protein